MTDQARGNGVEDLTQDEAATGRDENARSFKIGCPLSRQRTELRALQIDLFAAARIVPPDDLIDEAAIAVQIAEVPRAPQQQRIFHGLLQMAVGAFDRSVFMGDATIIPSDFFFLNSLDAL